MPSHGKGQPCPYCKTPILPMVFPSEGWRKWVKTVQIVVAGAGDLKRVRLGKDARQTVIVAPDQGPSRPWGILRGPLNCRALFFRDADRGDLFGYLQGLGDLLQDWEIIENDVQLVSTDGTRMLVDRARPRVELELTPVGEGQVELGLGASVGVSPQTP